MYDSVKYLCMGLRSCAHFDVVYSCWKYKQQPSRELARRKERGKRKSFVHNDDAGVVPHQIKYDKKFCFQSSILNTRQTFLLRN